MVCSLGCGNVEQADVAGDVVSLQIASYSTTYISSFIACPVRIRFKTLGESTNADVTIDEDNIDITVLGRRNIPGSGTALMNVTPAIDTTYTRVEIDLEDSCGAGASLNVTNTHGIFSTASRVTLVFSGTFLFDQAGEFLNLDLDNIITELVDVTADAQVPTEAQVASGTF